MYGQGPGGPGDPQQHSQHALPQSYAFPPAPSSGTHPHPSMAGMHGIPPPAPGSGHLPPPHAYAMPPHGAPPPGPPPPGPAPPGPYMAPGPYMHPQQHQYGAPPPQQQQQQQQHAYGQPQPQQPYNPLAYQQQHQHQPFMPPQPGPHGPGPSGAAPLPGFGGGFNPLGLMAAGNLLSGGSQWGAQAMERMQARVGAFTGGALHFHFAISKQYVLSKLLMLMAPYLRRWKYTRQEEQMQGGAAFKPPRADVNSPDLYIPLLGLWSYVLLVCGAAAARGKFKPDAMYPLVWTASTAWAVHLLLAKAILRAMALPGGVPWVELAAYTGYAFVPVCVATLAGQMGGRWAWYGAWLYGSTCMAVFLVRTMKRVIFQETRGYGRDLTLVNYLLLGLAAFQFPYAFYLGVRP